jgi:hypothetical protein
MLIFPTLKTQRAVFLVTKWLILICDEFVAKKKGLKK